jgi:eukaryotic-like serine/threonine-protein kinase
LEPIAVGPAGYESLAPSGVGGAPVGTLTAADHVIGTPLYMSPEAIAGAEADPFFDLWSLGVVLFEAIAGQNPFHADTIDEAFRKITATSVPGLGRAEGDASDNLDRFFARVLARDRKLRPRSAAELRNWLRSLRSDMSDLVN